MSSGVTQLDSSHTLNSSSVINELFHIYRNGNRQGILIKEALSCSNQKAAKLQSHEGLLSHKCYLQWLLNVSVTGHQVKDPHLWTLWQWSQWLTIPEKLKEAACILQRVLVVTCHSQFWANALHNLRMSSTHMSSMNEWSTSHSKAELYKQHCCAI